jgi:hypothetical protein
METNGTTHSSTQHRLATPDVAESDPGEVFSDPVVAASVRAKAFIRQNPGSCLFGAVLLGFAAGSWASRR